MIHDARANLALVRSHWGDLRDALEAEQAPVWPPTNLVDYLRALDEANAEALRTDAIAERLERNPYALGERPVPLRLTILDTILSVEADLLATADQVAAEEPEAVPEAMRWRYNASWRHGAPWACTWLSGALDWLPPASIRIVAEAADQAASRVRHALGMGRTHTRIPRPCPFCRLHSLRLHQGGDEPPEVTCETGYACPAPVLLDERGRRLWLAADLVGLLTAMNARASMAA